MFEDISDWLEDLQRDNFLFNDFKWGKSFPIINLILTIICITIFIVSLSERQ